MSGFSLPCVTSIGTSSCYHAESDIYHQPAGGAHPIAAMQVRNQTDHEPARHVTETYLSPGDDDLGRFGIIRVGERVGHDADASNYSARRTRHALREVAGVTDQHRRLRHLPHDKPTTSQVQAGVVGLSQHSVMRSLPSPQRSQRFLR